MMIFFIIAAAIIVILMCREAILHKGDFFEKTIMAASRSEPLEESMAGPLGDDPFQRGTVGVDPIVDGTLPGDPLYSVYHDEED